MLEPQTHRMPLDQASVYGHSRTRTTSSNANVYPPKHQSIPNAAQHQMLSQPGASQGFARRSPSVNTFSTASSMQPPAAYRTSSHSELRRSTSSRSGGASSQQQPSSYVALLRKQKATVWCDRAQYEDPRLAAQQRAAKMRANLEVVGGSRFGAGSRSNTGLTSGKVAAKIRHSGKNATVGYAEQMHVGVGGVPMRLSATEVEAESSDDDDTHTMARSHHRRTGSSGRSSTGSNRQSLAYRPSGAQPAQSTAATQRRSPADTPERRTSMAEGRAEPAAKPIDDAASGRAQSSRSGSSAERADNVTELTQPPRLANKSLMNAALTREKSVKSPEELRRRGSVDERTATLTSGRLFIANPD